MTCLVENISILCFNSMYYEMNRVAYNKAYKAITRGR